MASKNSVHVLDVLGTNRVVRRSALMQLHRIAVKPLIVVSSLPIQDCSVAHLTAVWIIGPTAAIVAVGCVADVIGSTPVPIVPVLRNATFPGPRWLNGSTTSCNCQSSWRNAGRSLKGAQSH
jgi:hypothetical protein